MTLTGRCCCGAVAFVVEGATRDVIDCHCPDCRRSTGHFMAATAAPVEAIHIDDDRTLRWFGPTKHAEYGFCSTCGSTLFWRGAAHLDEWSVSAGPLDPPTGLRTAEALFVAHASDYHTLDESIPGRAEE